MYNVASDMVGGGIGALADDAPGGVAKGIK